MSRDAYGKWFAESVMNKFNDLAEVVNSNAEEAEVRLFALEDAVESITTFLELGHKLDSDEWDGECSDQVFAVHNHFECDDMFKVVNYWFQKFEDEAEAHGVTLDEVEELKAERDEWLVTANDWIAEAHDMRRAAMRNRTLYNQALWELDDRDKELDEALASCTEMADRLAWDTHEFRLGGCAEMDEFIEEALAECTRLAEENQELRDSREIFRNANRAMAEELDDSRDSHQLAVARNIELREELAEAREDLALQDQGAGSRIIHELREELEQARAEAKMWKAEASDLHWMRHKFQAPVTMTPSDPEPAPGSVILDREGMPWLYGGITTWFTVGWGPESTWDQLQFPVTLLWDGSQS